ncbi:MAG: hypothetical protein ACWGQW_03555, partial [bacterium]
MELRLFGVIAPMVARGEKLTAPYTLWLGTAKKHYPRVYAKYREWLNQLKGTPGLRLPEEEQENTAPQNVKKDEDPPGPVSLKDIRKEDVLAAVSDAFGKRSEQQSGARSSKHV